MKTLAKMTAVLALTMAVVTQANANGVSNTALSTVAYGAKVKIEKDIYLPYSRIGNNFSEGLVNTNAGVEGVPFCTIHSDLPGQNINLKKGSTLEIELHEIEPADRNANRKMIAGNKNTMRLVSKKGNKLHMECQTWSEYKGTDELIMENSSVITVGDFQRVFGDKMTLKFRSGKF